MITEPRRSQKRSAYPLANNPRGSILVLALWSLCLLTAFAVITGYEVRQKIALVQRLDGRARLRLIGEAGVKSMCAEVKLIPEEEPVALNETKGAVRVTTLGGGQFSIGDYSGAATPELAPTQFGCIDEERKININKVDLRELQRLVCIVLGLDEMESQELAACIIDWRDGDSQLSLPVGSAEDSYYKNLPYPYEAKDGDFEVLDELLLVKGVTPEVFEKLKNYITIYGSGRVNVNTASRNVLVALGLNDDIAEKIVAFRRGLDGVAGTPDDNIFLAAQDIVPRLSQFYRFNDFEIAQMTAVTERFLVANSRYLMVKSTARLVASKNVAEIVSVIDRKGKVLSWREF